MGFYPLFYIFIGIGCDEKTAKADTFNVYGLTCDRPADDTVCLCGRGPVRAGHFSIARPDYYLSRPGHCELKREPGRIGDH
jgi:hypothetical protein